MANCVLCSTELKFMNTPTFGSGKLGDGGVVCTTCFKKINNANPSMAFKLKKHSLVDVKYMLHEKEIQNSEKNSRLGEIGVTVSPLRPGGKAQFGSEILDVISQGEMIQRGTRVKILGFSGHEAIVEGVSA